MAALLQSSVQVEERDAERELFSIDYVPPYAVLDEGEGLSLKSFLSEMCSLGQFCLAGMRSLGRMRWRGGSCTVSASSTHARWDAMV